MIRTRPSLSDAYYFSARLALARRKPDEALQHLAHAPASLGHPRRRWGGSSA